MIENNRIIVTQKLNNELKKKEAELRRQQEELRMMSEKLAQVQAMSAQEIEKMQTELNETNEKTTNMSSALARMRERLQKAVDERKECLQQKQAVEEKVETTVERAAAAETQVAQAESKVAEAEAHAAEAESKAAAAEAQVKKMLPPAEQVRAIKDKAREAIAEAKQETASTKGRLEEVLTYWRDSQEKMRSMRLQNDDAIHQAEVAKVQAESAAAESQAEQITTASKMQILQGLLEEERARNEKLALAVKTGTEQCLSTRKIAAFGAHEHAGMKHVVIPGKADFFAHVH